jgi:PilZ domain-containing protein
MPCSIRPSRRFPMCCPVTYQCGPFEGHGTVWNLSCTGWRLSGDLPLRIGEICSLIVNLPNQQHIMVAEAVVRWGRQTEYGIETITIQKHTHQWLQPFISDRLCCADPNHGRIRF